MMIFGAIKYIWCGHGILFWFIVLEVAQVANAETKEVQFTEKDCDQYRHYLSSENDVYNVVWYGEIYPGFCTLKFKLSTGLDTYRICAKVTRINLECGKDLAVVYSYGSTVYKVFDCKDRVPVDDYCSEDIIYINLRPYSDPVSSVSELKISITATLVSKYGEEDESSGALGGIITGAVAAFVVLVLVIVACVALRYRQATSQNSQQNGGVIVLEPNAYLMVTPGQQTCNTRQQTGSHQSDNYMLPYQQAVNSHVSPNQDQQGQHYNQQYGQFNGTAGNQSYKNKTNIDDQSQPPPSYSDVVK